MGKERESGGENIRMPSDRGEVNHIPEEDEQEIGSEVNDARDVDEDGEGRVLGGHEPILRQIRQPWNQSEEDGTHWKERVRECECVCDGM